jgi:hypothetical protein
MTQGVLPAVVPQSGVPARVRTGGSALTRRRRAGEAIFRAYFAQRPSEVQRAALAVTLGVSTDDVPDYFETLQDLLVWGLGEMAVRGNQWALAEILDRIAPKPRRMEVSGPDGGPLRAHLTASAPSSEEAAEARAYYDALRRQAAGDEE